MGYNKSVAGKSKKLRILIVDDHALIRDGLKNILFLFPEIEEIKEAINGKEAVEKALDLKPDLILLDIQMPEMNGMEALKELKKKLPETKVVMLTVYDEEPLVSQALKLGADGYLVKNSSREEIYRAIKEVMEEKTYVSSEVAGDLIKGFFAEGKDSVKNKLTSREIEVLQLMAEGKTNKEIAFNLKLSVQTVKTHIKNIFRKLGVADRAQAVAKGLRTHLIE